MRKYLSYFKISIGNTFAYRGPIIVWLVGNLFPIVTFSTLWLSASAGNQIAGFTRAELVTYYILGLLVEWLTNWYPYYWIKDEIADGSIVGSALTKPISNYWRIFSVESGWHFVTFFFGVISVIALVLVARNYFIFPYSLLNIVLSLASVILSIFLIFSLSLCMGYLAFWFTKIDAVDSLFWAARMFLGGQALPISFLPHFMRVITFALPFRYMFSFPLEIYLGKVPASQLPSAFIIQAVWIVIFVLLARLMWIKGNQAYTSFGN